VQPIDGEEDRFPESEQTVLLPVHDKIVAIAKPASRCIISPTKTPLQTTSSTVLKAVEFNSRMFVLAPQSATRSQKANHTMVFYVVSGVLDTEIANTQLTLHGGSHFFVPRGSDFTFQNPQSVNPTTLHCVTLKESKDTVDNKEAAVEALKSTTGETPNDNKRKSSGTSPSKKKKK